MNCCNHHTDDPHDRNEKENTHAHHGHMSHMWMMALCCGAPLVLLLVISVLGASLPGLKALLISILPFICPIMMIAMLPMMFMHGRRDDGCHEEKSGDQNNGMDIQDRNRLN